MEHPPAVTVSPYPLVTVAVAAQDAAQAQPTLAALAAQEPGVPFEVLCVLTGEGAAAEEDALVSALASSGLRAAYRVLPLPGAGWGEARDAAVRQARGEHIAFVEAPDTVSEAFVRALGSHVGISRIPLARVEGERVAVPEGARGTARPIDLPQLVGLPVGSLLRVADLARSPYGDETSELVAGTRRLISYPQQLDELVLDPAAEGAVYRRAQPRRLDPEEGLRELRLLAATAASVPPHSRRLLVEVGRQLVPALRATGVNEARLREALPPGLPLDSDGASEAGPGAGSGPGAEHPYLSRLVSPIDPTTPALTVVAWNGRLLNRWAPAMRYLKRCGTKVTAVHVAGRPSGRVRSNAKVVPATRLDPGEAAAAVSRLRDGMARRAHGLLGTPAPAPRSARLPDAETKAPEAAEALRASEALYVLDERGMALVRSFDGLEQAQTHSQPEFALEIMRLATHRPLGRPDDVEAVADVARRLAQNAGRLGLTPEPWAVVAYRMMRGWQMEGCLEVIAAAQGVFSPQECRRYGLDALAFLAGRGGDPTTEQAGAIADEVLAVADDELARGDALLAAFLTTIALDVLFFSDLHTSVPMTPLTTDGQAWTRPLREHPAARLLTTDSPRVDERPLPQGRARVLLLPGAFPKFSGVVTKALAEHALVREVRLSEVEARFSNTVPDPVTTAQVMLAARGEAPELPRYLREEIRSADVVFADWADKGAVLASRTVTPGTRLVVRCHGVDTLSAWIHAIDWGRVTDLLLPSPHLERAARDLLGDRLEGVRVHVLPNHVETSRFDTAKEPGAERTLGLVGWARRVKDPTFAVDVLGHLREEDPSWRLLLIGEDYAPALRRVEAEDAERLRARVMAEDVRDGIEFVGHTRRLEDHLRRVGWGLSTSVRESFHIGLAEMAASGAVPVVRDWPVYAPWEGTRTLFPADWVVESPREAADRILRIAAEGRWEAERLATRQTIEDRFGHEGTEAAMRRVVLGLD